jgi:hypothetical protein
VFDENLEIDSLLLCGADSRNIQYAGITHAYLTYRTCYYGHGIQGR